MNLSDFLNRRICFLFLIIFLCGYHTSTVYAEKTVKLVTGEWCPYICNPELHNGLNGYLADIASTVFQKAGYKVELRIVPLGRAFMMCRKGRIDGLLALYEDDAPDLIHTKHAQGTSSSAFLTRKENPWKYTGMQSLNQVRNLGLVKDYEYPIIGDFIRKHPDKVTMVKDKDSLKKRLEMMLRDRIDVLVDDSIVIKYTLKKMKLTELFTEAGNLGDSHPVNIAAFSPVIPESKKYAEILVNGIEELRKSGELDKIMDKYGLKDWKK